MVVSNDVASARYRGPAINTVSLRQACCDQSRPSAVFETARNARRVWSAPNIGDMT